MVVSLTGPGSGVLGQDVRYEQLVDVAIDEHLVDGRVTGVYLLLVVQPAHLDRGVTWREKLKDLAGGINIKVYFNDLFVNEHCLLTVLIY